MWLRWSVGCNTASMGKDGIHGIHEIHDHGVAQFHLRRSRRSQLNAVAAKATSLPPGAPERLNESSRNTMIEDIEDDSMRKSQKRSERMRKEANFLFQKMFFAKDVRFERIVIVSRWAIAKTFRSA